MDQGLEISHIAKQAEGKADGENLTVQQEATFRREITMEIKNSVLSVADHKGLVITYRNLNYHVQSNSGKKGERAYLLKNVSGYFKPGEMSALMGPSGSGKTTLLDVLAGRKNAGVVEGTIQFSGFKPTRAFLRRYTGYVEQFDTLIGALTVQEMLMYTAELKRSMEEPLHIKKQAVAELLEKLALVPCKDVKIGDAGNKGISGGQAKRTNIGIALITNPRVLFLDEPTSGLDSYTSNEVMAVVKKLVFDGTTVCATIHSPSSYCFDLFDSLTMLVRGQMVYFGPQGRSAILFALSAHAEPKEYKEGHNDAEFMVDLVTDADRHGRGPMLAEHYDNSTLKRDNERILDELSSIHESLPPEIEKELNTKKATNTPWWFSIMMLFKYRTRMNYSSPAWLAPRIADKVFISLIILLLFWKVGKYADDSSNVINISAVLFMWAVMPAFGAQSYVPALVLERNLFARERNDGLYYTATYLIHKILEELLVAGLGSLAVCAYLFYAVQFGGEFVLFWLVYWITLSTGIVMAYFFAAISPNLDAANALLPTYGITLVFFTGFIITFPAMPRYCLWYSYINFLRYGWGAQMVNQFKGNPVIWTDNLTVLEAFGLDDVDKWTYVGYEALFFIFFFIITLITMTLKKYQTR